MDYSEIFRKCIRGEEQFGEALKMARQNSRGKIWLVGGCIFRNLAHALCRAPKPDKHDFDFVAEELTEINLLPGWKVGKNSFGNPKFYSGFLTVDIWPLKSTYSIIRRKLKPTIENYLTGVSFTIQSIAYDLVSEKIIGSTGLKALETKAIAINNLESLNAFAKLHGISPAEYVRRRLAAWDLLGFKNECRLPI